MKGRTIIETAVGDVLRVRIPAPRKVLLVVALSIGTARAALAEESSTKPGSGWAPAETTATSSIATEVLCFESSFGLLPTSPRALAGEDPRSGAFLIAAGMSVLSYRAHLEVALSATVLDALSGGSATTGARDASLVGFDLGVGRYTPLDDTFFVVPGLRAGWARVWQDAAAPPEVALCRGRCGPDAALEAQRDLFSAGADVRLGASFSGSARGEGCGGFYVALDARVIALAPGGGSAKLTGDVGPSARAWAESVVAREAGVHWLGLVALTVGGRVSFAAGCASSQSGGGGSGYPARWEPVPGTPAGPSRR